MGATINQLKTLSDLGALSHGSKVLDLGLQNLVHVTPDEFVDFVMRHNPIYDTQDLYSYATQISEISEIDPNYGGINGAWVGDILRRAGIEYTAFDIFESKGVVVFDLNRDDLPEIYCNYFDVCFNFGTTEHVINQLNCFKILHQAVNIGGFMYHQLPMSGVFDHGYFSYNPAFLESIAAVNEYDLIDCWIGTHPPTDFVAEYRKKYPARKVLCQGGETAPVSQINLNLIARKTRDYPFRIPLETSTTLGAVSNRVVREEQPSPESDEVRGEDRLDQIEAAIADADDSLSLYFLRKRRAAIIGEMLQGRAIKVR